MRKVYLILGLFFVFFVFAGDSSAQTCPNSVCTVSQSFVDDANTAFKEVVALRDANGALRQANDALIKANAANAAAVDALHASNETLKQQNADLAKLKCDKGNVLFILIRWTRCK
ncbi:MAG: hypothetical protein JO053_14390 [Acidobacteria bacterium]|nr:hypothetical protein [Acidobacteriota bacterium]